ncbi:MAG TPA: amidohydrolase family protein [Solirubrobacterales bacterium]|nr:amidohydrolase family protein [Solirubrobacterales bacterium]
MREELSLLAAEGLSHFDSHAHTGADLDGTVRTIEEHARDTEVLGGRSVVFPLHVDDGYAKENRRVVAECAARPDLFVPFARLDPRVSAAADAVDALSGGARGFKLHPRSEGFRLDHPNVAEIVAVAAAERRPVLIHAGLGVGSFGQSLLELARANREAPLILAHAGVSDLAWLAPLVPEHPNLFFDTAWWIPTDLQALFALVPPGRILFGSDAPYMDVALLLALCLRCARHSGLDDDAVALVGGGQLDALLAGEAAHDAGPAPGAPPLSPPRRRLGALLAGATGALAGGGDPSVPLELVALAMEPEAEGEGSPSLLELVELGSEASPESLPALALAAARVLAPVAGDAVVAA